MLSLGFTWLTTYVTSDRHLTRLIVYIIYTYFFIILNETRIFRLAHKPRRHIDGAVGVLQRDEVGVICQLLGPISGLGGGWG